MPAVTESRRPAATSRNASRKPCCGRLPRFRGPLHARVARDVTGKLPAPMSHDHLTQPPVRRPYVAGHFYPGDEAGLRRDVESFLQPVEDGPRDAMGVVVPHAGYMYSGAVAGHVYSSARLPRRLVILGPNHTGLGKPVAVMCHGLWETPLGTALIDETLAGLILDMATMAEEDETAHRNEHSLEVQIPFLQTNRRNFLFAPVCVGTSRRDVLIALGEAIASAIESLGEPVGIVISTDMTHFEKAEQARKKDFIAIEKMKSLDAVGLHTAVREHDITMCGSGPVTAGLHALKKMGASTADLIAYGNSGDTSGNYNEVVGYAGLLIR